MRPSSLASATDIKSFTRVRRLSASRVPELDQEIVAVDGAAVCIPAYRRTGQHDMAQEIAALIEREIADVRQKVDSAGGTGNHQLLYREAEFLAIEGRVDEAIAALRRWQSFDPAQFNYLKSDPFLTSLHGEAEFWQIVAEVEAGLAMIRQQVEAARSREVSNQP